MPGWSTPSCRRCSWFSFRSEGREDIGVHKLCFLYEELEVGCVVDVGEPKVLEARIARASETSLDAARTNASLAAGLEWAPEDGSKTRCSRAGERSLSEAAPARCVLVTGCSMAPANCRTVGTARRCNQDVQASTFVVWMKAVRLVVVAMVEAGRGAKPIGHRHRVGVAAAGTAASILFSGPTHGERTLETDDVS